MRVIIAGGRDFSNYKLLCETMGALELPVSEVVCGGARGADSLGERWALENSVKITYFNAEWEKYGKAAGMKRNHQMGDYADYLVAFWDCRSRGTMDMINYMEQIGKHGKVVCY